MDLFFKNLLTKWLPSSKKSEYQPANYIPDHLIEEIFSYLPTKEVVRTSAVARRWRYFWISMPNISLLDDGHTFGVGDICRGTQHSRFFHNVVIESGTRIKKFQYSSEKIEGPEWNDWLNAIMAEGLQELDLKIGGVSIYLNSRIVEDRLNLCRSLVKLRLHLQLFRHTFPNEFSFPHLKHIELDGFILGNNFCRMLLGCPILNTLILNYFHVDRMNIIDVEPIVPYVEILPDLSYALVHCDCGFQINQATRCFMRDLLSVIYMATNVHLSYNVLQYIGEYPDQLSWFVDVKLLTVELKPNVLPGLGYLLGRTTPAVLHLALDANYNFGIGNEVQHGAMLEELRSTCLISPI